MDVENLLESCYSYRTSGKSGDSVMKKIMRKKKVEDWKKIMRRQRVENWKRGVLWKDEGSVVLPPIESRGGGGAGEYELEEGEFVPSEDDRMSNEEDAVSLSSRDRFIVKEVVELEEGEFVGSPVKEAHCKEEGEFVELMFPDNETHGAESYGKEENEFGEFVLPENEARGDESNSKEGGDFVDSLSLDYEYSGDEEGEFVGLASVDVEKLTELEECELEDAGFCQQFQSSEEYAGLVNEVQKHHGLRNGLGTEFEVEEHGGDVEKLNAVEECELEGAGFCIQFQSYEKQKSTKPVNEVRKHHGLSDGVVNDFKVEEQGGFLDCGHVESSDFSTSSQTPDGVKSSVPVEACYSETTKSFEVDQIKPPESMVLDSPKCSDSFRESINPSEAFESQTSERAQIFDETQLHDSERDVNGLDSKNIYSNVSHTEEKDLHGSLASQLPVDSTLPGSVQLMDPVESQELLLIRESLKESLYKNLPQRSVSAYRTFPAGCGRQALLDIFGGCQKSLQNFIARTLGDGKSFAKSKSEKIVRANAEQRREKVTYRDAFKEKGERNLTQGIKVAERVQVRKNVDGKLKQNHTQGTSSMLSRDTGIRSSIQERGLNSVTFSNDTSIKRNLVEKYVERSQFINPPQVQKYAVGEPSTERVTGQALKAAANCPWSPGVHACRLPIGLAQSTTKGIAKKHKLVVGNPSKSVSRKSYDAAGYDFYGHDEEEEDDSPLYKRARNRELNSTPSSMNTFSVKDFDTQGSVARNKVRKTLRLFQSICRILLRDEEGKPSEGGRSRVDLKTATILKENNKCLNAGMKILGSVPGVEIGQEFHYRAELAVIGLHSHYQNGIDYMYRGSKILATSIVSSGGYDDFMDSSNVLVYSGQGGNPTRGALVATDQKLVRGNLALKNSMDEQTPVRVIRGFKEAKDHDTVDARTNMVATLTYDGLYLVEKYWQQKGTYGNNVFMFQLRRISGQPELAIKELKNSKKAMVREGICMKDISHGKERIPIGAVNTIDNEKAPTFVYLPKMKHSVPYNPIPSKGCQCKNGCFGSNECSCAMKNGGQIPFSYDGAIVESRPLVYECGPKCQCPPSCRNRVSQNGIKFPLEIFKTKFSGWGVRSLKSIPSGSFICEYTGELIQETDAEQRTGNDEYLFDVGCDYDDHTLWEGLSSLIPSDIKSSSLCESVEDVGFTIDAAHQGNIGRFINHSCSPNLYAQNVLYDHGDKRMPHIMLFAAENIPPLEELTYHYNMEVGQVRDQDGNIKKKKCYCGSSECTGRIY